MRRNLFVGGNAPAESGFKNQNFFIHFYDVFWFKCIFIEQAMAEDKSDEWYLKKGKSKQEA